MRILFLVLVICMSAYSWSQSFPENASKKTYGSGWKCNSGFYKTGNQCSKVKIPKNAVLNVYGSGWKCNSGFYKTSNQCAKVQIPKNASLNVYGSGWKCNSGFYKTSNQCAKVQIPTNASLNVYGSGWKCNSGFKKSGGSCIKMTQQEIRKQHESKKAMIAEIQRRKALGVSGDDCENEYKTNAEVCVEITSSSIDCNESYSGNYYDDCDISLSYEVNTDYSGGAYLDVEVECNVEIEYKGKQTYSTQSDYNSQDESYSLYAQGSESETLSFNFSFGSYQEINSVKISSAECEIDSVEMY